MAKMTTGRPSRLLAGLSLGVLALMGVAGCQENTITYTELQAQAPTEPQIEWAEDSRGTPIDPTPEVVNPTILASKREYGVRSNPFALLPAEYTFDLEQRTERFLADFGGWEPFEVPPIVVTPRPVLQPLPQWRLSGVIIGNGVLALLDTGSKVYEIRPGMTIPDTDWRVVSIDSERAILVRDSNVLPREFQVDLTGIIGGGPTGNTGGATAPGGAGPGGVPGRSGGSGLGVPGRGGGGAGQID